MKMMNYLKVKADFEKFKADKEKNRQKMSKPSIGRAKIRKK